MKKYNNTKTVLSVSNKSAILVYIVAALMISTGAIYFIVASQDYSELSQSVSTLANSSNNTNENKEAVDTIATVNEMIFFIVTGIAYIAAGIWMMENKYYSKIPYVIAAIGSIALIAFYISTRTTNIPSRNTRGCRYNRYPFQSSASSYSWYINIHCQNVNNSMEKCYNNKSSTIIPS